MFCCPFRRGGAQANPVQSLNITFNVTFRLCLEARRRFGTCGSLLIGETVEQPAIGAKSADFRQEYANQTAIYFDSQCVDRAGAPRRNLGLQPLFTTRSIWRNPSC